MLNAKLVWFKKVICWESFLGQSGNRFFGQIFFKRGRQTLKKFDLKKLNLKKKKNKK